MTYLEGSIEDFIRLRVEEELESLNQARDLGVIRPGFFLAISNMMNGYLEILKLHDQWPTLVEKPMKFEPANLATSDYDPAGYVNTMTWSVTQEIAWMTHNSYIERFGTAPPSAPILRIIAKNWANHADYKEEWSIA